MNRDHDLPAAHRTAHSIVVLTGAGVSAESGVPTFRDALAGLWAKFDPQQLATPEAFARDPALVSRWYDERRCNVARCKPNAGHVALAELQRRVVAEGRTFTLITQNVDRLHQAAGSTDVIELHGTLWVWRCIRCGRESEERGPAFDTYPVNCACGAPKRPGVVWFGEELPAEAFRLAHDAASRADLFFSIGTSSVVYPAAGLIDVTLDNGARLIEVNTDDTPYTDRAHWALRGTSGEVLPRLLEALRADSGEGVSPSRGRP